jgi:hypothetical protein
MFGRTNIIDHLAEEDEERLIKVQTRSLHYLINDLIDDRIEELKLFEFVKITGQIMNICVKQFKILCVRCFSEDESNCLVDKNLFPNLFQWYV